MPRTCLLLLLWTVISAAASAADPPGYEGQTKQVIEQALKQYQSAQSYQDRLITVIEVDASGEDKIQPPPPTEMTLAFQRPNKIALRTPDYSIVSDGKTLWQVFTAIEQYIQKPAPEAIELQALEINKFPVYERYNHPIAFVLTATPPAPADLLRNVAEYTGTKLEKRGEKELAVVSGRLKAGDEGFAPFEAVFSGDTNLLLSLTLDETELIRKRIERMGADVRINRSIQQLRFENIKLKEKPPAGVFEIEPGALLEKVTEFNLPDTHQYQQKLVGRPAPDFTAKGFNGETVKLADFRGKVLLLDFWASWCRPCLMAMPQIQKLADSYAGKPVAIIGVNGDDLPPETAPATAPQSSPGTAPATQPVDRFAPLKQFLKRGNITYPQISNAGTSINEDYRAMTIPYAVLIDKNGIIAAIHPGFSPTMTSILQAQIDALLRGERLPPPGSEPATATAPAATAEE